MEIDNKSPNNRSSLPLGDPVIDEDRNCGNEDVDTWLRDSYDEIVALQRPYDPTQMTVRGPVFPTRCKER